MVTFPILIGEIAKRGIKKKAIAEVLGIDGRTLSNKLAGKTAFTWAEVKSIRNNFFPDFTVDALFETSPSDVD